MGATKGRGGRKPLGRNWCLVVPLEKLMRPAGAGRMIAGLIPTRGGPGVNALDPPLGAGPLMGVSGSAAADGVISGPASTVGGAGATGAIGAAGAKICTLGNGRA